MAENKNIEVGGRLHSIATGNVLAGANEIIDDDKGKKQSQINDETDAALEDRYTKEQTYSKSELNNMITTPNQEYETYNATDQTTDVTDVLPATGEADTVYRVGNWDGSQFDASVYSEYAWNGSQYVHLSTKTQIGEVFDISAYHATGGTLATYADLSAALDSNNGGGVPQSLQKGGMSVKFVRTSDNKYVQYRLMTDEFTTDTTQWAIADEGVYMENAEFAAVYTDSNERIWLAVKKNGDVVFGYGVPNQIVSYIEEQINVIKTGASGTNIDGLNKITAFLNGFTTNETLKEYLGNTYGKYEDNSEFARVEVDNNGKLWLAVKNNGDVYFGYGVPEQIKEFITNSRSGITLLNLLNNDKRKYYYEQINSGTTIFTPTSIVGGSYLVVRFKTSGAHCALGFFDSNDTRISFNGLSNVVAGTEYFEVVHVPLNYAKATIIWGNAVDFEVYDFKSDDRLEYYYENGLLDDIPSTLKLGGNWMPDYLKDEMKITIETINGLVDDKAIVLPIQTDSHISSDPRFGETSYESLACLAYLCNNCYVDGIVHLGDVVRQDYWSFLMAEGMTEAQANAEGRLIMQEYFMRFAKMHKLPMITNGNHDGVQFNKFYSKEWYGMVGRMLQANDKVHLEGNTPYFYVDFEKCNVRCVFMSCPDSYNDSYPIFGWTQQQLNWLANTALNVEDGTNIILFSHVSPLQASYTNNGLERLSSFKGICDAFDEHTSFNDSNVSCDFSNITSGKILCEICGHQHMDWVWNPGDSYEGTAVHVGEQEGPISWTYENTFAFPIICITNTYFGTNGDGETRDGQGGIHVPRVDRTSTQEAWDILVYRPDLNKVKLIRFGSGQDREVNV